VRTEAATRPRVAFIASSPDPTIASSRLRALLPARYLADYGWTAEIWDGRGRRSFDVVVFQKIYGRRELELAAVLRSNGTRTVFDLCDNHFYNPDGLPHLAERAERLRQMIGTVDAVTVSTAALQQFVPRPTTVIDDALDEIETPKPRPHWLDRVTPFSSKERLKLVWFGNAGLESPPFGLVHLPRILPVLNALASERSLELTVISNSRPTFEQAVAGAAFHTRYVSWKLRTFASEFVRNDICVMPIEPNPFTICKTSNRVALSLKLGVPVVADPIPSFEPFRDVMQLGDWPLNLRRYADDPELRERHVADGRRLVEQMYTPERLVGQWSALLEGVGTGSDKPEEGGEVAATKGALGS
jgi:hypothetical protein